MRFISLGTLALLGLAACSGNDADSARDARSADGGATAATGRLAPREPSKTLSLNPTTAIPGDHIELSWRDTADRVHGMAYFMSRANGAAWSEPLFVLISDAGRRDVTPSWGPHPGTGWEDLGVPTPITERLVVPASAEPGEYRICPANESDERFGCVYLSVANR
jgi:hypothetical protein